MFTNITRTTLCITAFSIASLMAAPLNATKTESLDWNWKFARFGKMPDGSTQPEPGKAMGFATATSEESGNPADNAVDGDKSTRWCASSGKSGEKITVDMGRPVDVKTVNILWEKQSNHLFKLEGSGDGKRWATIEDKTSGQNDSKEDTVENKTGKPRYFRITVTGNSNVTVGGTRWTGNVTIGAGSALSLSQVDFKSSDIILDGTFNLGVCGIDSGGNGARLVFGIGGIMNVNQKIWGASDFSVSGTLATTSTDLAAGEFQFVTRTLITSAGFDGGSISLGDFTAEDGGALTKASGIMEGNAADYQGQYYLYTEDGNVKVQYVVAGAVPEPATATLSLLGLASLMLRRRRA